MKRIKSFMEQYHMITRGDRIVAGVSGGADSVCLFFVLLKLREELGFEFMAVHVNHCHRGEASYTDEDFVRRLCEKNDVALEIFREDVESIAKKRKQSFEEAGRQVRHEAFEAVMKKYNCNKIALAHHQNDNAETMLWNLSRGTGLRGLGGIRPVNGAFIRPLLCLNRSEIEQYLTEWGQDYCTDETNAEPCHTRNKLRHFVLPVLEEQANAQAVRHMNEAMEQIWEVQDYMEQQACAAYEKCVEYRDEMTCDCKQYRQNQKEAEKINSHSIEILLRQQEFSEYPPVLQKMMIRRALEEMTGQMKDVGQVHIEAVRDLFTKQAGRSLDLPYQIQAKRVYDGIRFQIKNNGHGKTETAETCAAELMESQQKMTKLPLLLTIPGETSIPEQNLTIRCKILEKKEDFSVNDIPEKVYTKWFDYDIIERSLYIRTREQGDRIGIDKDGHCQKLKSWFVNEKIPAESRDTQLLIAEGNNILWIPGYRMSTVYQIREHTKRILQIEMIQDKKASADS